MLSLHYTCHTLGQLFLQTSIDCFADALARTPVQVLPSNSALPSTKSDGKIENEMSNKKRNKKAVAKKCTISNSNADLTLDVVAD